MRHLLRRLAATSSLLALAAVMTPPAVADDLQTLSADFWTWRAVHQPLSGDDVNRIERPAGWLPDWSGATVEERRGDLEEFRRRWQALDPTGPSDQPTSEAEVTAATAEAASEPAATERALDRSVDHRLIGSALARVEWELDIHPTWRIDPWFYVAQTEGAVFELLLEPAPFTAERSAAVVARLESIPDTIFEARRNLDLLARPFAEAALTHLRGARGRLQATASQLRPELVGVEAERLYEATEAAIASLEGFARWLEEQLPAATAETAVGAADFDFFLSRVALIPWSREELQVRARQEVERAVAFESIERNRNRDLPELPLLESQEEQMARSADAEVAVRAFLDDQDLLTLPEGMASYRNLPMPSYLRPLSALGVTDDLTSPGRLGQDAVSYLRQPSVDPGYFERASARDPRPVLVHEGVPGHYAQLVLSWSHDNPIRRHYYDSAANEGIAFYAEEMMMRAGFFDDSPRTREILCNFMRLRALRVEVDVKLATGELTVDAAADYLEKQVPMDRATALAEALSFAANPGQAISYQAGKLQITRFLSEARQAEGQAFSLRRFHDTLWKNGNVPIALQRWEYLGLDDEIRELDRR